MRPRPSRLRAVSAPSRGSRGPAPARRRRRCTLASSAPAERVASQRRAEEHVGASRVGRTGIVERRADQRVGPSVPVQVAQREAAAELVTRGVLRGQDRECTEPDRAAGERSALDQVRAPGVRGRQIEERRSDQKIGASVAVRVSQGQRLTEAVARGLALQDGRGRGGRARSAARRRRGRRRARRSDCRRRALRPRPRTGRRCHRRRSRRRPRWFRNGRLRRRRSSGTWRCSRSR